MQMDATDFPLKIYSRSALSCSQIILHASTGIDFYELPKRNHANITPRCKLQVLRGVSEPNSSSSREGSY
jgi:hypothetical protein